MKIMIAILCSLIGWLSIPMKKEQLNFSKTEQLELNFDQDSGYINKLQADYLLKKFHIVSKKNLKRKIYTADSDTLGKYYRSDLTGNYIICIVDCYTGDFETHVLIELKPKSNDSFEVIAVEHYLHGNYSCCWDNTHEGFRKTGHFFTLKICGTGSGFCDGHQYVFQKVHAQKQLRPIYKQMFSFMDLDTALCFHPISRSRITN